MKFCLAIMCILLGGCAQIIAQEYQKELANCREPNLTALVNDQVKTADAKKSELAAYNRCNMAIQQEYYPEYSHLWQRHFANQELHFSKVLNGELTLEEAKVLDAESYAQLNSEATSINMASQQLQMQKQAQANAYTQQYLQQRAVQQQYLQSIQPKQTHCTYRAWGNSINSTCW